MRKLLAHLIFPVLTLFADEAPQCLVLPEAEPPVVCPMGFYFTGEVIYWSGRTEGLGFSTSRWPNFLVDGVKQGSVTHPDFGFDPGFKVGLGFDMRHDGWDIFTEYTWLHTKTALNAADNTLVSTQRGLTWLQTDSAGTLLQPSSLTTESSASWNLHFNVIDLEIGRNFFVGRFLNLRPFIGLKGAWQEQSFLTQYIVYPAVGQDSHLKMRQKQNFWGVGVRSGVQSQWRLASHFSLVGRMAITSLVGKFHIQRRDKAENIALVAPRPVAVTLNTQAKETAQIPVMEFFLGLRWGKFFKVDRYFYQMDIGWEEQVWMNQNQFLDLIETGSHGDLGLQGLTFRVRLDF